MKNTLDIYVPRYFNLLDIFYLDIFYLDILVLDISVSIFWPPIL